MQNKVQLEHAAGYLPSVVLDIVALIGFPQTNKLIESFGGTTFRFTDGGYYYPKLSELIGVENADTLRRHFKSEHVYIPRCDAALRALRNYQFKSEFDLMVMEENVSARLAMLVLCPKYGFSDRLGWNIIKNLDSNTPFNQQRLFD